MTAAEPETRNQFITYAQKTVSNLSIFYRKVKNN